MLDAISKPQAETQSLVAVGAPADLPSGRRLTQNALWNLAGQGIPLLAALLAVPVLVGGLGVVRFGVLALATSLIGYFGVFDLGLGRTLTKMVAERVGTPDDGDVPDLVWTGLAMMSVLGLVAAAVLACVTPVLVYDVLRVPADVAQETVSAFYLVALAMPFVVTSTGFRGLLEAQQRFVAVNAVRAPMGVFTFLGPAAALLISSSLVVTIGALMIVRVVGCTAYAVLSIRSMPVQRRAVRLNRRVAGPLVCFGGWLTVSSAVGPLLLYLDRFLIGAAISTAAVAYYTTPFDVVTRLWIIPTAVLGTVFPAFSATLRRKPAQSRRLYAQAAVAVSLALLPAVVLVVVAAYELLAFWVGPDFAANGFRVAQILAIGVLINSFALVSSALVQAAGRPDLTAKLHLLELPLYVAYLWPLMQALGIVGVALAWLLRVSLSAVVLWWIARRLLYRLQDAQAPITHLEGEELSA